MDEWAKNAVSLLVCKCSNQLLQIELDILDIIVRAIKEGDEGVDTVKVNLSTLCTRYESEFVFGSLPKAFGIVYQSGMNIFRQKGTYYEDLCFVVVRNAA